MSNTIDLDKLENLKIDSNGWTSACPLCRYEGRDKTGNHLKIYPNGAFGCVVAQKDKNHNAGILKLAGTESDGNVFNLTYREYEPKIVMEKTWDISILDKLIKDYSYFEGRGISAETQMHFNIGVASSGQLAGRAVVPIINNGKIIAFTGRLTNYTKWHKENKIGKWKHLSNINDSIFCGDESSVKDTNTIIIVEGPADVLALYEKGIKNAICIFGTKISSKQLSFIIKNNPSKILIALNNEPDNDNIGNKAAEKVKNVLLNYFNEEKILTALPKHKDFLEYLEKNDTNGLDEWREKWLS